MFKVIVNDDNIELPDDDIFYVVGKNGQFIRKNMGLIDALVPVKSISILNNVKPYVRMKIPKIPSKVFTRVVSFFKNVYRLHHSEAVVMLYLETDSKKYYIHVPPQKVSGASVEYERNVSFPGKTLVGTIHSHSNFGAFHSGTDKDDEKGFDGIHITVGNLGEDMYHSVACSLVSNGFRVKVEPEDYVHIGKNSTAEYIILEGHFPLEWLAQVTHEAPVVRYHWRSQRRRYSRNDEAFEPGVFEENGDTYGLPFGYDEHFDYLGGIYASPHDFAPPFDFEAHRNRVRGNTQEKEVIIIRDKTDIEKFFDQDKKDDEDLLALALSDPGSQESQLLDNYYELTDYQRQKICNTCALTKDCCSTCMHNETFRAQVKAYRELHNRQGG